MVVNDRGPSVTEVPYYEIRLYVGCREGYHGERFGKRELMKAIRDFQADPPPPLADKVSVRITKCTYQVGDWDEDGWEVAAIDYPRFPKGEPYLAAWFNGLAIHLLAALRQNRITVCSPSWSRTYETEGNGANNRSEKPPEMVRE